MLRRKATWIDKSVNLKQVLKDPRALRALQDFAISIHAGENVAAWCARVIATWQCSHTCTTALQGCAFPARAVLRKC